MDAFHQLFIQEVKRRLFSESVPRLKKCLAQLSEEEIWHRPNANANSMGNLVLHLCGNARQWIVSGLGGVPDTRQRQGEFDEKGPVGSDKMLADLDALMAEIDTTLDQLQPGALLATYSIQGFTENGISVLVHVVEHFSYHVGQMTYYVKAIKDMDMGYYPDDDLDVTGG